MIGDLTREPASEPILVDFFNYGKLVKGEKRRVPPGTGYSVTRHTRNLNELLLGAMAPTRVLDGMLLDQSAISSSSQAEGCLILRRIQLGSNPDNAYRYVLMRARYRREGGDAGGGRPYLQAAAWVFNADDWIGHCEAILSRHLDRLTAEPDAIETPASERIRVAPLELGVREPAAGVPEDSPDDVAPAVLELLWTMKSARGDGVRLMGEEWFDDEKAFFSAVGRALALVRHLPNVVGRMGFSAGLKGAPRGAWISYRPGERFERRPLADGDAIACWLHHIDPHHVDPQPTTPVAAAVPHARHPRGDEASDRRHIEQTLLRSLQRSPSSHGAQSREAPSNGAHNLQRTLHDKVHEQPGKPSLPHDLTERVVAWRSKFREFRERPADPTGFLLLGQAICTRMDQADGALRDELELSNGERAALDLISGGVGCLPHWDMLTLEGVDFLLKVEAHWAHSSAFMAKWWETTIAAVAAWFEELGVLAPHELARVEGQHIRHARLVAPLQKITRRSEVFRAATSGGMREHDQALLDEALRLMDIRLEKNRRTEKPRYSFKVDTDIHSLGYGIGSVDLVKISQENEEIEAFVQEWLQIVEHDRRFAGALAAMRAKRRRSQACGAGSGKCGGQVAG